MSAKRKRTARAGAGGQLVRVAALASAASLGLVPHAASANAAIMFYDAGAGGALLPRSSADVRIVSERLEFIESLPSTEAPDDDARPNPWWHVRVDYVLENLTAERLELDVGFPVAGARGDWEQLDYGERRWTDGDGTELFDASFHVRLDGAELPHRSAENDCPPAAEGTDTEGAGLCYPHVFLFRAVLEAQAQVALTVEYDQSPAWCCDPDSGEDTLRAWVDYILETGALWAGPIGRLDIVCRFALPPVGGVLVYDGVVGPLLPRRGPWGRVDDDGDMFGWSQRAHRVAAPEGVMELWDPAVRFHYAFACKDGRIVLRLKATDVEPGGNISFGVLERGDRLFSMEYPDSEKLRPACAATRTRGHGSDDPWSRWERQVVRNGRVRPERLDESPPEWPCRFVRHYGPSVRVGAVEYAYDCCGAAVADEGRWNPDCDKEGGSRKGCAAAAIPAAVAGGPASGTEAGTVGTVDAGTAPSAAEENAAVPEAGPEAGSSAAEGAGSPPVDGTGRPEPPEAATAPAPPAPTPPTADAAASPTQSRPTKGCGCAAAGAGGGAWIAAVGALAALRLGRRGLLVRVGRDVHRPATRQSAGRRRRSRR
ncbi:MAG: hypothetical protein JXB32_16700 [Deltaproteobacteria bacterium]|nr:hypothetical protein [Deltaproteobacteria bacterium]